MYYYYIMWYLGALKDLSILKYIISVHIPSVKVEPVTAQYSKIFVAFGF